MSRLLGPRSRPLTLVNRSDHCAHWGCSAQSAQMQPSVAGSHTPSSVQLLVSVQNGSAAQFGQTQSLRPPMASSHRPSEQP